MIKAGLNAELDGQAGIQELAGDATMLYYMTDEAQSGKLLKTETEWINSVPSLNSQEDSLENIEKLSRNFSIFSKDFPPNNSL